MHPHPKTRKPLRRLVPGILVAALGAGLWTSPLAAQTYEPPSFDLPFHYDTGYGQNDGTELDVVLSFPVFVDSATWLQLKFAKVDLSGDPEAGTGSFLRITSMEDTAEQRQNAIHVEQWRNASAFFNGDGILVEVLSYPNTGKNRVVLEMVTAGIEFTDKSQCGSQDNRVLSSDVRVARAMSGGCTAWIINDACGCLLTAGHCRSSTSYVEFNVPLSTSGGSIRHPGPEDQYSLDNSSVQYTYGDIGNDWCYFGVHPNSNTGLTPFEAQGDAFDLTTPPSYSSGQQIRITGHGVDYDDPTHNQVQQTHSGPRMNPGSGTILEYQVDTEGGNSGSPVIFESTGQGIGIHTHGGCNPPYSGNYGTGANNSGLQYALANPRGVCDCGVEADFFGTPTTGNVPLTVNFTDLTTGGPTSWLWTFGDSGTSFAQNPSHVYTSVGTYTVSLTASNAASSDTETKTNYIIVVDQGASVTWRNGSGVNPDIYSSTSLPVLGTNWTTQIDGGAVGASGLSFVVGYSAPLGGVPTPIGELLIDISSSWMITHIAGGSSGISYHSIPIPNDPALAGVTAYTQGFLNNVGGGAMLTNALDATMGY